MRIVPVRSLAHVGVGETVSVVDVPGVDPVSLRLLEMGLTPGVAVAVVAAAPLGDPLELELRGYRLSIRRREAALVTVAS
jgi:Fe2+ transport system protein FeoA